MPELKYEQRQAVFHNEGNILISASAGSGKTFVMIERVIRLITEGKASVKEILAVTFTELAASEMKEKLKDALIDKINQTHDKRLINEFNEVATADICTLHAFCGRLIRNYFFKAEVSPDFKILDESEASIIRQECINKVFKEFYEKGEEWFLKLTKRHEENRSNEQFKQTLLKMRDLCFVNADTELYSKLARHYYSKEGFLDLLDEYKRNVDKELIRLISVAKDALYVFNKENNEKFATFANELISDLEILAFSQDVYAFKQFSGYKKDLPRGGKRSPEFVQASSSIGWVRNELKELIETVNAGLTDKASDLNDLTELSAHTEGLFKIIGRFNEVYASAKAEENGLDFSDLEHFALKVLADDQIRQAIREKYKYLFVDEYQDVNGVQEQIITSIANDNLFMVGDAKQSIYGFRGCRPEIFIDKQKKMETDGQKTVMLNCNFRSANAVLDTVNEIFSYSMTQDLYGTSYKDQAMLVPGGVYPEEHRGRTELHLLKSSSRTAKAQETPRIYNVLEELKKESVKEQSSVSMLVADIIYKELGKDVYDPKLKRLRPVGFGDIAVLTRNKDNGYVRGIVKGLTTFGIPTVSVVKESVCDYPEIKALVSVLELVDCFSQDIPLASTLKSVVGGFSDEELAKIAISYRDSGGQGSFYNAFCHYLDSGEDQGLKDRLNQFKQYFDRIRLISDFVGAHGVLKRIVSDKNIEQNLLAERFGEAKVKRLNLFVSASVVDDKCISVKEFLSRIKNFPSAFGLSEATEENAVKVMTIHASKGLEFPVVIVCGLERNASSREEREDIMFDYDMGFAVKLYDDYNKTVRETPLRAFFRRKMQENRLKEELRLFYVALTRASFSLHMTFESTKDTRKEVFTGAKKFFDYLPSSIEATEHDREEFNLLTAKAVQIRKVLIGRPDQEKVEEMKENFSFAYPFEEDTALSLKVSVTKAVKNNEEEYPTAELYNEDKEYEGAFDRREQGVIAHKILELLDFSKINEFDSQVKAMVDGGLITNEQVGKIDLERLKKALECSAFNSLNGKTLYREKSFIISIEGDKVLNTTSKESVLLQGIIDLLAVSDNEAIIIDYKYSSSNLETLKTRYAKQLELYAYALEKATGIKVKTKALVNIYKGESVIID